MYYPVGAFDGLISTFWNPLDAYGVTLSNFNYTALVDGHGSADSTRPHAGWDNLEITTGKWYWEVRVETCAASGTLPMLSFGLRSAWDGMARDIANPTFSGSYEDRELRFVSDGMGHIETTTIPDIAVWHSNQGSAPEPVHDFAEIAGNYFAVDTTGVSGFTSGDILMFALDRDAGLFWIGKNGTWFNSGNPAAGTGYQFSNMDCSEAQYFGTEIPWRFFFATTGCNYASSPLLFHLATGSSFVPQTYAAPSGFESFTDPASVATSGTNWRYRDAAGDWMTPTPFLAINSCWPSGATIALNAVSCYAFSNGIMQLGRKYYWEMFSNTVGPQLFIGAAQFANGGSGNTTTGIVCLWGQAGTLHDGVASITMNTTGVSGFTNTDRMMLAVDLVDGKMWIGKNGTWFNSGDPAAGTNPQFSGLPLDDEWVAKGVITSNARECDFAYSGSAYLYSTPTGFTTTIPLVEAFVPF